jgi:hypothetical protein
MAMVTADSVQSPTKGGMRMPFLCLLSGDKDDETHGPSAAFGQRATERFVGLPLNRRSHSRSAHPLASSLPRLHRSLAHPITKHAVVDAQLPGNCTIGFRSSTQSGASRLITPSNSAASLQSSLIGRCLHDGKQMPPRCVHERGLVVPRTVITRWTLRAACLRASG